jgi:hypothetical protein
MTKRGRPPREDGRKTRLIQYRATDEEHSEILAKLSTDGRRIGMQSRIRFPEMSEDLKDSRTRNRVNA